MARACKICKDDKKKGLYHSQVFTRGGSTMILRLCREHDIEFFKMGQIRFMAKYGLRSPTEDDILNTDSGEDAA